MTQLAEDPDVRADEMESERELLATQDLEQARDIITRVYIPHDLRTRDGNLLDFRLRHLRSERLTVGHCIYGADAELTVPPMGDCYHVNLTLQGQTSVTQRRTTAETEGRKSAVLLGPTEPFTVRWSPEAVQYALKVPRLSLEAHLSRLINRAVERPVEFDLGFDLSGARGQALLSAIRFLREELTRPGGIATMPMARDQLESLVMTQLLLTVPNEYSELLQSAERPAGRDVVRAALELIDEHPERNLTLAELAGAVGSSARGLQRGFANSIGMSPIAYLRSVRLDRVRADLLTGAAGRSVSDVAMSWGFYHLGRFAQQYKERFGVLPSEVLNNARRAQEDPPST
ncbi:AraC family transcriptional regulator [Pseudonocardia sulfidoxydans NBRC 16205]|uniref:AraC family transcriptional regulator n=1 Tax=Pseudonocardia sulfidoxydans NBRC 16205 TaxID=1223511 RepID=A0A511DGT6_9PSEU|nr:AraC family transcriptional regulator [Pseudonocardia sulfidoxydans]GEL23737.1 AraC family transcriptional regulator [Pseudonocardia sulfidoxydans NBRC 16205]